MNNQENRPVLDAGLRYCPACNGRGAEGESCVNPVCENGLISAEPEYRADYARTCEEAPRLRHISRA